MDWKCSIIWFNDCIWDFWWRDNWESLHDSVRIFFSDLWNEEGTHTWSCSTTEWVSNLESLKAIASFSFFSSNIEYGVNKFCTLSVVTLGPVVTSTSLTEDKVVRSEELTKRTSSNRVHCSWFEIHKDSSGDITTTSCFIIVDIDSFELKIWITVVRTGRINTMFIRNNFPELSTNLVTALTSLYVDNLSHDCFEFEISYVNVIKMNYLI